MIHVRVLYLSGIREWMGRAEEALEVEDRMTVFALRRLLFHDLPRNEAAAFFEGLSFLVNLEKVALNRVLREGDRVTVQVLKGAGKP